MPVAAGGRVEHHRWHICKTGDPAAKSSTGARFFQCRTLKRLQIGKGVDDLNAVMPRLVGRWTD